MPRLLELLHAVRKTKTPSMTLPVRVPEGTEDPIQWCKRLAHRHLVYTTLGEFVLTTSLVYDPPTKPLYGPTALDAAAVMRYAACYGIEHDYWNTPWCLKLELGTAARNNPNKPLPDIDSCVDRLRDAHTDCRVLAFFDTETKRYVLHLRKPRMEEDDDEEQKRLNQKMDAVVKTRFCGNESVTGAFVRNEGDDWYIDTQGSCLNEVHALCPSLRPEGAFSNDPREVLEVLGIEAARTVLMQEVNNVLAFDGSYVNSRHLKLLADMMTGTGTLTAINNAGYQTNNTSVLGRASFERVFQVFQNGACEQNVDKLTGVSENIMVGNLCKLGTGMTDLQLNEDMIQHAFEHDEPVDEGIHPLYDEHRPLVGGPNALVGSVHENLTPTLDTSPPATSPSNGVFFGCAASSNNTVAQFSPADPFAAFSPDQTSPGTEVPSTPAYAPSSPAYVPSNGFGTATSPPYSPATSPYQPTLPTYDYGPSGGAVSPPYQPSMDTNGNNGGGYSPSSPAYSPAGGGGQVYSPSSPAYSPAGGGGQVDSPSAPAYSPSDTNVGGVVTHSPAYSASAPSYVPPTYETTPPNIPPVSEKSLVEHPPPQPQSTVPDFEVTTLPHPVVRNPITPPPLAVPTPPPAQPPAPASAIPTPALATSVVEKKRQQRPKQTPSKPKARNVSSPNYSYDEPQSGTVRAKRRTLNHRTQKAEPSKPKPKPGDQPEPFLMDPVPTRTQRANFTSARPVDAICGALGATNTKTKTADSKRKFTFAVRK